MIRVFNNYKDNLKLDGNKVYSYNTHVATISGGTLKQLGYWSKTTQKHINYVAQVKGLEIIKD
jgi:hypothetical protein